MTHYLSPSSSAPMTSTILWKLPLIKQSTKDGAWQAFSTLRDEHLIEYCQSDLFTKAKSHNVSEILDPRFIPGPSQEDQDLFEPKQPFMYKVFKETLLTDMGWTKVRKYLKSQMHKLFGKNIQST